MKTIWVIRHGVTSILPKSGMLASERTCKGPWTWWYLSYLSCCYLFCWFWLCGGPGRRPSCSKSSVLGWILLLLSIDSVFSSCSIKFQSIIISDILIINDIIFNFYNFLKFIKFLIYKSAIGKFLSVLFSNHHSINFSQLGYSSQNFKFWLFNRPFLIL